MKEYIIMKMKFKVLKEEYRQGDQRTFSPSDKEYSLLQAVADELTKQSPNKWTYSVKDVYLDADSDWKWTTIHCDDRKNGYQALNPREWFDIVNEKSTPAEIAKEILADKFNPDVKESLKEDTVKQDNHWVNKGKEGTHGKFRTKKEADAQREAMFAQGFKEDLSTEDAFIENEDDWGNDDFDKADKWKFVKSKEVVDSDGFTTEYVWYKGVDPDTDKSINIFMFGDSDLYEPSIEDADWIEYDDLAAREWFDNYESGYLSTDELEDQEEAEWEETKKKWAEEDEEFFSDKHWDEMDSLSKDDFEEDLKFVNNRKNAILGKGDDPGFDEYDLVDNDEEEFTDEDDLDESTLQEKKQKPAEVKSMIGIRGDMDDIVEDAEQKVELEEDHSKKRLDQIADYFKAWGWPGQRELQEVIDFYKLTENDFNYLMSFTEGRYGEFLKNNKLKFIEENLESKDTETRKCKWCENKFEVKKDSKETLCPNCRYGVKGGMDLEEASKESDKDFVPDDAFEDIKLTEEQAKKLFPEPASMPANLQPVVTNKLDTSIDRPQIVSESATNTTVVNPQNPNPVNLDENLDFDDIDINQIK